MVKKDFSAYNKQNNFILEENLDRRFRVADEDIILTELVLYSSGNGDRILLELEDGTTAALVPPEDLNLLKALES